MRCEAGAGQAGSELRARLRSLEESCAEARASLPRAREASADADAALRAREDELASARTALDAQGTECAALQAEYTVKIEDFIARLDGMHANKSGLADAQARLLDLGYDLGAGEVLPRFYAKFICNFAILREMHWQFRYF